MKYTDMQRIESYLEGLPKGLLKIFISLAKETNIKSIALVGGTVRDLLISSKGINLSKKIYDLDFTIEGSSSDFSNKLLNQLGKKRVQIIRNNDKYKTVEIVLDGIKVDIATSREENYIIPAENPVVKKTNLETDLKRRDFNINSIAIDIMRNKIIDINGGIEAINKRKIDFLHSKSVLEDPTRVIRAARYAARLNFNLSPQAITQINSTIKKWPWNWRKNDEAKKAPSALSSRLRMEFELLFKNEPWEDAIKYLKDWEALNLLDSKIQEDPKWLIKLKNAKELKIDLLTTLIVMAKDSKSLGERLCLSTEQQKIINDNIKFKFFINKISSSKEYLDWLPSQWTQRIEELHLHPDAVAIEICGESLIRRQLLMWFKHWRFTKSPITGLELLKKGWKPGPDIGKELKRLRNKLLDKNEFNEFE